MGDKIYLADYSDDRDVMGIRFIRRVVKLGEVNCGVVGFEIKEEAVFSLFNLSHVYLIFQTQYGSHWGPLVLRRPRYLDQYLPFRLILPHSHIML